MSWGRRNPQAVCCLPYAIFCISYVIYLYALYARYRITYVVFHCKISEDVQGIEKRDEFKSISKWDLRNLEGKRGAWARKGVRFWESGPYFVMTINFVDTRQYCTKPAVIAIQNGGRIDAHTLPKGAAYSFFATWQGLLIYHTTTLMVLIIYLISKKRTLTNPL